jgi:hypothetical protein
MRSPTFTAAALLLLTVTVAGCGTGESWSAFMSSVAATTTPQTTTPTPTTTTTTTTTTPTPTTTAPPAAAADGTNLQACQDGACEVEIKAGDMLNIKGLTMQVASVEPDGLTFVMPDGSVFSFSGGPLSVNGVFTIEILRGGGPSAIVRIY